RTDQEAIDVVGRMLSQRLRVLEDDETYLTALKTIKDLQQPILDSLSERIKEPLEQFLPGINSVSIEIPDDTRRNSLRRDFEIIVDDGTPTSLAFKGDGVKSLAALGLLKDRVRTDGASIIAIEEPESHLHPAAIHQLLKVIKSLGEENQV
ncbi:TPA: ATP-dependent endonuclease, partial [Escherichia coli]